MTFRFLYAIQTSFVQVLRQNISQQFTSTPPNPLNQSDKLEHESSTKHQQCLSNLGSLGPSFFDKAFQFH